MIAYIVTAKINDAATYLVANRDDQLVMVASSHPNETFNATLFKNKQGALNAIDHLRHGVAKHCRILRVTIDEESDKA